MTPVNKTKKTADAAKVVEEAVIAEAAKVEETAAPVKEEIKKVEEIVKKAEEKVKAAAPKKTAAKKTADKAKTSTKKTAEKKAADEPAAPTAAVFIEHGGRQYAAKAVLEQAMNVYKDTHKGVEIKTIEIYIKPEESVAYYVVNGEGSSDFKIDL